MNLNNKYFVFGIDLGTNCGVAVLDARREIRYHETWKLTFPRAGDLSQRLRSLIYKYMEDGGLVIVGFENVVSHKGSAAAHLYGSYKETLFWVSKDLDFDVHPFSVSAIKRYASGKGNASKSEMISSMESFFKIKNLDDNEADALAVASLLYSNLGLS